MRARCCLFAAAALSLSACSNVFGLTEVHVDGPPTGDARSHDGDDRDGNGRDDATAADAFVDTCNFTASGIEFANPILGESDYTRTVMARGGGVDVSAYVDTQGVELAVGSGQATASQIGFSPRVSPDGTDVYFVDTGTAQPMVFTGDFTTPQKVTFTRGTQPVDFQAGSELGTPSTIAAGQRHMVVRTGTDFDEYTEDTPGGNAWSFLRTLDVGEKDISSPDLSPDGRSLVFAHTVAGRYEIDRARRATIDATAWATEVLVADSSAKYGTISAPFLDCMTLYFTSNTGRIDTQIATAP